jgi:hypothetical protein
LIRAETSSRVSSPTVHGSPQAIVTRWKFPSFHVCEPWIAPQTIGTCSFTATIAAPGWTTPGTPERCRVPSTKTPRQPPSRTTSRIRRTASRSDSPRRMANESNSRMN